MARLSALESRFDERMWAELLFVIVNVRLELGSDVVRD